MNGADWRQYFSFGIFEKKPHSQKKKSKFFISYQKIDPQTSNTRLGHYEPLFI